MCDLPQLKAKGTLTAATLYSSTSYFQYKMRPMGYEYEMIQDFARSQGLELQIKVAENTTRLVEHCSKQARLTSPPTRFRLPTR